MMNLPNDLFQYVYKYYISTMVLYGSQYAYIMVLEKRTCCHASGNSFKLIKIKRRKKLQDGRLEETCSKIKFA